MGPPPPLLLRVLGFGFWVVVGVGFSRFISPIEMDRVPHDGVKDNDIFSKKINMATAPRCGFKRVHQLEFIAFRSTR